MPVTPAPPAPVTITYALDADATRTEAFDYLIVACDPRGLAIDDPTALEARVKEALTSFTFHTSLFKADRPGMDAARGPSYASRFNPSALEKMDGSPYAFRDEVFAHDPVLKADKTGKTWCVLYQLEGKPLIGRKREEVRKELNKVRDKTIADGGIVDGGGDGQTWIDWKPDGSEKPQPEEDTLVDYFAHFDDKELDEGLPWAIRDAQGEKNTFYVASFTCFESVLHCYLYEEQLMDPKGRVVKEGIFPADKTKSFAVVGAGPSGLLFATQHLLKKGYANFKIFEASDRFGGKTFTYRRKAPGDGSEVPCELGTCFLSPAYEPMWWLFEEYDAGKIISLDRDSNLFQSVIDKDEAKTPEEKCDGVEYRAWTVRKNGPDLVVRVLASCVYSLMDVCFDSY
jgi:NAD(P)-binding Rossmann-like domain